MPVAILGMHRSGTSMLMGLLKHAGLHVGAEQDLVPASDDNRKGHWEHKEFVRLNTAVLALAGGAAEDPPLIEDGWFESTELGPLREEAKQSVARIFGEHTEWGWKDPRTALTVPFWRSVVPGLRFIICVRNPLDAAASHVKRNGVTQRKAMALWQYYNEAALRNTRPEERIVVFNEDFFQELRHNLAPVLRYLNLPLPEEDSEAWRIIQEFVDTGLQHHNHTLDDVLRTSDAFTVTKLLYSGLRRHPDEIDAIFRAPVYEEYVVRGWGAQEQNIIEGQNAYIARQAHEIAKLRAWTGKQHEALEWQQGQTIALENELSSVRAWTTEQQQTITLQAQQIVELSQELTDLRQWATHQDEVVTAQNAEIAKLRDWSEELRSGLEWRKGQVEYLESELADARERMTKQREVIDARSVGRS